MHLHASTGGFLHTLGQFAEAHQWRMTEVFGDKLSPQNISVLCWTIFFVNFGPLGYIIPQTVYCCGSLLGKKTLVNGHSL